MMIYSTHAVTAFVRVMSYAGGEYAAMGGIMTDALKVIAAEFDEITSPREVIRTVEISLDDHVYRIEVYERHEDLLAPEAPFGVHVYVDASMPTRPEGSRVWARDANSKEHYPNADTALRAMLRELIERAAARKQRSAR